MLEHHHEPLMNLREGDGIPMLPNMPVDDSWKIPGTPDQGSDLPRKSWFPVTNGLVFHGFSSFPHQTRGFHWIFPSNKPGMNMIQRPEFRISTETTELGMHIKPGSFVILSIPFLWNQLFLSSTTIQSEQSRCSVESYRLCAVSSCSIHV